MWVQNKTILSVIYALIACVIWSGNFVVARDVQSWMYPIGFGFWRWLIAFLCIVPLLLRVPNLRQQLAMVKEAPWVFILMGVLGVGCFNTMIYWSAKYTTTHNIALIAATAPIWTVLLASMLKQERLNRYKITAVICASLGAFWVVLQGDVNRLLSLSFNRGDLILFIASWIWAFYCILLRYNPKMMDASVFLAVISAIGLCILTPGYIMEYHMIGHTPFSVHALNVYLYVAIGASVIAWFGWNYAVQHIGAVRTGVIYYTMPVFSGVMAYSFLGEPLALYHFVGFACVFAGILISNIKR